MPIGKGPRLVLAGCKHIADKIGCSAAGLDQYDAHDVFS